MCGVTPLTVRRHTVKGLKDAMVADKIDLDHPNTQQFIENMRAMKTLDKRVLQFCAETPNWTIETLRREFDIGQKTAKRLAEQADQTNRVKVEGARIKTERKKSEEEPTKHEVPEDLREYAHLTLTELIQEFGTDYQFTDWLKALKAIEDITTAKLKNAATKRELVSFNLIKLGVLEPIELAHIQLMTDGAKTIARRVCSMYESGRRVEECEKFVSDQISSFIKPMKARILKAIKNV